jgi:hypothetical protein
MPRSSSQSKPTRSSGGERVFADATGRLWSAASLSDGGGLMVVFTCISDGRQSGRALVIESPAEEVGDVEEKILRAWLEAAPRIGRLT